MLRKERWKVWVQPERDDSEIEAIERYKRSPVYKIVEAVWAHEAVQIFVKNGYVRPGTRTVYVERDENHWSAKTRAFEVEVKEKQITRRYVSDIEEVEDER